MAYEERKTKSWGSKLGDGLKSVVIGLILIVVATALLFWNEGRAVKTADCINEVESVYVTLPDINTLNSELNGTVVYAQGNAQTETVLEDGRFNIQKNALSLRYSAEYYQWVETKTEREEKNVGGSSEVITTYDYEKRWVTQPVDSSNFKQSETHHNFILMEVDTDTIYATDVNLGAYQLPDFLYKGIKASEPLALEFDEETYAEYAQALKANITALTTVQGSQNIITTGEFDVLTPEAIGREYVHVKSDSVYIGRHSLSPQVGDVRIKTSYTPASTPIAMVAMLNGNTFSKFVGKACKDGYEYSSIYDGQKTATEIFESNRQENSMLKWGLRFVGLFLLFIAFGMFFKLGEALLDVLPFLGNAFKYAGNMLAGLLALAWTLVVIGIGWLYYRPIHSIILFAVAAGLVFLGYMLRKKRKEQVLAASAVASPGDAKTIGQQDLGN
ncbi:MAG: TMEM43 family protein [Alcaligenaceae bacterium]|nr:TMEM43 family protein [Alcaligenaceae bacterium]